MKRIETKKGLKINEEESKFELIFPNWNNYVRRFIKSYVKNAKVNTWKDTKAKQFSYFHSPYGPIAD